MEKKIGAMKKGNVLKYDDFINEEEGWKTAVAGVALAGALTFGGCDNHKGIAKLNDTEQIGNQSFKEYDLHAAGESFKLTIKDQFMIAHHSYSESHGSGKSRHTVTYNIYNLFIPPDVKFIWYLNKTFGGIYASTKPIDGGHLIKMSDLEVNKDTPNYTLYKMKGFFEFCPFRYIIVMKKGAKATGEEFQFSDKNIGIYSCERINKNLFIFYTKGLGSGKMGGGGAGSSF